MDVANLRRITGILEAITPAIPDIYEELRATRADLDGIADTINHASKVPALEATIESQARAITELQTTVAGLQRDLASKTASIAALESTINTKNSPPIEIDSSSDDDESPASKRIKTNNTESGSRSAESTVLLDGTPEKKKTTVSAKSVATNPSKLETGNVVMLSAPNISPHPTSDPSMEAPKSSNSSAPRSRSVQNAEVRLATTNPRGKTRKRN